VAEVDAFGWALRDWARGATTPEILEREDGFTEEGAGHELYVAEPARWPAAERRALRWVRGRVVDVGCGAGRVPLHLQRLGHEVVGVDTSPLAIATARARGVRQAHRLSAEALTASIGSYGTVVLFGNNFGLGGTPGRIRRTLTSWARRAAPGTRILAESTSPYGGGAPCITVDYMRANRRRRRMAGQVRLRVRYGRRTGPWFYWLFVSPHQMRTMVRGTGWRPVAICETSGDQPYVMVLETGGRSRPPPGGGAGRGP
jgi:SAM-dependent methyltransferase